MENPEASNTYLGGFCWFWGSAYRGPWGVRRETEQGLWKDWLAPGLALSQEQ